MTTSRPGVYVPTGQSGYELCHPVNPLDFDYIYNQINGEMRLPTWQPIPMRLVEIADGELLHKSDSPWLGSHALIFRPSAIERIGSILTDNGELLPIQTTDADLVIYNATSVVDALDRSCSDIVHFDDGRIMRIRRYAFYHDIVHQVDIFKLFGLRVSPIFVSHRFVDKWKESRLQGLEFDQVWPIP